MLLPIIIVAVVVAIGIGIAVARSTRRTTTEPTDTTAAPTATTAPAPAQPAPVEPAVVEPTAAAAAEAAPEPAPSIAEAVGPGAPPEVDAPEVDAPAEAEPVASATKVDEPIVDGSTVEQPEPEPEPEAEAGVVGIVAESGPVEAETDTENIVEPSLADDASREAPAVEATPVEDAPVEVHTIADAGPVLDGEPVAEVTDADATVGTPEVEPVAVADEPATLTDETDAAELEPAAVAEVVVESEPEVEPESEPDAPIAEPVAALAADEPASEGAEVEEIHEVEEIDELELRADDADDAVAEPVATTDAPIDEPEAAIEPLAVEPVIGLVDEADLVVEPLPEPVAETPEVEIEVVVETSEPVAHAVDAEVVQQPETGVAEPVAEDDTEDDTEGETVAAVAELGPDEAAPDASADGEVATTGPVADTDADPAPDDTPEPLVRARLEPAAETAGEVADATATGEVDDEAEDDRRFSRFNSANRVPTYVPPIEVLRAKAAESDAARAIAPEGTDADDAIDVTTPAAEETLVLSDELELEPPVEAPIPRLLPEPELDPVDHILKALINRARERQVAIADVAAELIEQANLEGSDIDEVLAGLVGRASDEDQVDPGRRLEELTLFNDSVPRRPGQITDYERLGSVEKKRALIRVLCLLVAMQEDNRLKPKEPRSEAETRHWPLARAVWPVPADRNAAEADAAAAEADEAADANGRLPGRRLARSKR